MSVPSFSGWVASSLEGQGHNFLIFYWQGHDLIFFQEISGKVIFQIIMMVMLVTIMAVMV